MCRGTRGKSFLKIEKILCASSLRDKVADYEIKLEFAESYIPQYSLN